MIFFKFMTLYARLYRLIEGLHDSVIEEVLARREHGFDLARHETYHSAPERCRTGEMRPDARRLVDSLRDFARDASGRAAAGQIAALDKLGEKHTRVERLSLNQDGAPQYSFNGAAPHRVLFLIVDEIPQILIERGRGVCGTMFFDDNLIVFLGSLAGFVPPHAEKKLLYRLGR